MISQDQPDQKTQQQRERKGAQPNLIQMAQEFSTAKHARAEHHAKGGDQSFPGKGNAGKCHLDATKHRAADGSDGREVARRFGGDWRRFQRGAVAFQHREHIGRPTLHRHRIARAQHKNGAGAIHDVHCRKINRVGFFGYGARHLGPKRRRSFGIQRA